MQDRHTVTMVEFPFFVSSVCVCCCVSLFPVFNLFACIYCLYMGLVAWYKKWNKQETRNILDCDQSNYSSRIILAHIPAKLLSWSWIIQRIPEIGLYSFEIFQDDVRPPLGFGSTGSRSIQFANPENYISRLPNMWIAHYKQYGGCESVGVEWLAVLFGQ